MFLSVCAVCLADSVTIIATGDSITNGYVPTGLQNAFNARQFDATVLSNIASGGCDASRYTGRSSLNGEFRNYADDVLAQSPDVILLMLGINDAYWAGPDYPTIWPNYQAYMDEVFDKFEAGAEGKKPAVVLATIMPVTRAGKEGTNDLLNSDFNPWLKQQTAAHHFYLVDTHDLLMSQPNWQAFESDGLHLYGNNGVQNGYDWLAGTMADATMAAVPEPATLSLVGLGLAAIIARRKTRQGS